MRKAISKKLRFEVFKRDGFTCQYCGKKAPDVVLHVDHVAPVAKGGKNDILNLITSCSDCNLGKGPRELDDSAMLAKQQQQLAELNEKREQLSMMLKWREELKSIDKMKVDEVVRLHNEATPGSKLSPRGIATVEQWVRDFPMDILLDSIDVSRSKLELDKDGRATDQSWSEFHSYIPRVASCKLRDRQDPGIGDLLRLRGYMKTWMDFRGWECLALLKEGVARGLSVERMKSIANSCSYWSKFQSEMYEAMRR